MTVFTITSLQAEEVWLNLPRILNFLVELRTGSPVWIILHPGYQGGKGSNMIAIKVAFNHTELKPSTIVS